MASSVISIPRRLPLLIAADGVLLPGASMRIPVTTPKNMSMIKTHLLSRNTLSSTIIGVIPKEPGTDTDPEDYAALHGIGTAAVVVQITGTNWPRPAYTLLLTGLCRFRLERILQESPFPIGLVSQLDKLPGEDVEQDDSNTELINLIDSLREQAARLVDMLDVSVPIVAKLKRMLNSVPSHHLADICASIVRTSYQEKLQVLDAIDLADRFRRTLPLLMKQIESLHLLQKARKGQMVKPLQVKRIIHKLPTDDVNEDDVEEADDIADLENKIKAAKMPEHARKVAMKELQRLKKMTPQMPEHAMTRTYLELMAEVPWSKKSTETLDINKSRKDLDADHYAMDKLKKRVLEYLAVRQLRNTLKGPILCFVGPPGVGKTSVGRSIANTLGREFHRIALGGLCDQSDIRGHRRTYIGAMPGRIIQGVRTVQTNNPVFLLDEIDKMGSGIHGDPAAALLEVLDPEQNNTFTDHYLNVPFDLSQVLFIATANTTATIPPALLDRMELIHVPGYTQEEKVQIAIQHLIPKQLREHGLSSDIVVIPEESVKAIISKYTREAGVRNLERKIGALCRAVAVQVAERKQSGGGGSEGGQEEILTHRKNPGPQDQILSKEEETALSVALTNAPPKMPIVLDETAVEDILGPSIYDNEMSGRLGQPGVAVGLAWTPVGGELMFVEATKMEGDGQLVLTGQLGDVMKESAKLAINWVRTHAQQYGIPTTPGTDLLENKDVHIHFPAGAVGKDGPSAGVTIITVLVSLFTDRCVRTDVAMTGEITLRGLVLPVGGIKDKVLAAHRACIRTIVLPKRNEKDILEIPTSVQNDMTFVYASHVDDVLQAAFEGGFPDATSDSDILRSKL